ncbi:MAG: spermidine synthase [Candidatus Eremiobacteraeota bacterium]|nr:spermidine synthase [Candidatus Eremiobacteraeota bacterium]
MSIRLFLLSFLMLFVELALIRWLGARVFYLSFFSNFVLLGSFLGIGIGFLRAGSKEDLFPWAGVALTFFVAFVLVFPVQIDRSGSQLIFFGGEPSGLPMWLLLPAIFAVVATVMASIAQQVGRAFAQFDPLSAYRLDILGSLAGIAVFTYLSFLGAPPVVWAALALGVSFFLFRPSLQRVAIVAGVCLLGMLARESFDPRWTWSPYYEILTFPITPHSLALNVNGIPFQVIESTANRAKDEPHYFLPYRRLHRNPLRDVLIVGAGNGGDVAIALHAGAAHVDAVEIDPKIHRLGERLNPDRPFDDPRVTSYIDDGRAFLQRTDKQYDLVLFALPDSLTLVSGQGALRLESYLFTVEAMRAARRHVAPGGAFGMYNYYRQQWLIDRYARTLETVYGHAPCIDSIGQLAWFALLIVGREPGDVVCAQTWNPQGRAVPPPVTDDAPFPYLQTPSIPPLYLATIALILIVSLVMVRAVCGPLGQMAPYADLFCMGAAFLLLETKNVVGFALLFGTTWLVNALVFFGILLSVLAAIEFSARVTVKRPAWLYLALFAGLALTWAVPPSTLLELSPLLRFAAAAALAFAPVFLANVIFAQRFRAVASSTVAFGANLLGAMAGGVLEYSSLLIGYRSLLIVVAALYGLAFFFGRKHLGYSVVRPSNALASVTSSA